ncbi:hypothetical protein KEJ39_01730 [Candidatus Bathyarchaeota archaeon]|nr:hypothetical protein [Candidatus Bathyarchaeota archaeon]
MRRSHHAMSIVLIFAGVLVVSLILCRQGSFAESTTPSYMITFDTIPADTGTIIFNGTRYADEPAERILE